MKFIVVAVIMVGTICGSAWSDLDTCQDKILKDLADQYVADGVLPQPPTIKEAHVPLENILQMRLLVVEKALTDVLKVNTTLRRRVSDLEQEVRDMKKTSPIWDNVRYYPTAVWETIKDVPSFIGAFFTQCKNWVVKLF